MGKKFNEYFSEFLTELHRIFISTGRLTSNEEFINGVRKSILSTKFESVKIGELLAIYLVNSILQG